MAVRPKARQFTVDEYYRMAQAGILGEDDHVELINGEIVQMTPIGSRHAACVDRLNRLLSGAAADRAIVRVQNPLRLGDLSEPEPDLSLLRTRDDYYESAHPGPGDVLLVVEVSDSSLEYDRATKVPLYAASGVGEVWIVDLTQRQVEVYRSPGPGGFGEHGEVGSDGVLSPLALPDVVVAVSSILGS